MQATARVFAQAFANATSTCKKSLCKVEVDVIAEAVASVLSSAASAAKANVCFGADPSPAAALPLVAAPWRNIPCNVTGLLVFPPTMCLDLHVACDGCCQFPPGMSVRVAWGCPGGEAGTISRP